MNNRERVHAILHYNDYDRLPVVHFGFWIETLIKWMQEGHLNESEVKGWYDGNEYDKSIGDKLGFDFNWYTCFHTNTGLKPSFEPKVIEELPDGTKKVFNHNGVIIIEKPGIVSISSEVDHLLKDRSSWEEFYLPKLQCSLDRIDFNVLEYLINNPNRDTPLGIHCGSLFGVIRDWMGLEGVSYLYADDEDLYDEIIDTVSNLCYSITKKALSVKIKFDFGHFWEDICFKNGPLVNPSVFNEKVGPHYKKLTELLNSYGIYIVSLDCDGMIDSLIPTWLNNGVNTMFPIEVGTWNGNISQWRRKFGAGLRGVGGMNKNVFSEDYAAIDAEIERLKPMIEMGGYIPCPDHRIPPTAKWENVQYYCEKMKNLFR
jgi:uroporphyrinogen decarboxylase